MSARIAYLEERLAKKDSVIAQISAEFVQLNVDFAHSDG
jgi:uncharacterized coiled-coil protein SlyX